LAKAGKNNEDSTGRSLSENSEIPVSRAKHRMRLLTRTGLVAPVLAAGGIGLCMGALDILAVAFAGRHHHIAMVAWVSAALAVSSAVGGLAYGAVSWRISGKARLVSLASILAVSLALAGESPNIYVLVAAVAFLGLFVSPTLTTAYLLADEIAEPGARTEAGTWVNTSYNLGNSAGASGIGLLIGSFSLPTCFAIAAAAALVPAAFTALSMAFTRAPKSQPTEQSIS
jgi:MFS family permease